MQVTNFRVLCPYIAPNDWICFHDDIALKEAGFTDVALGITHNIDSANTILQALKTGGYFREITAATLDQEHLCELLGFSNALGALKLERSLMGTLQSFTKRIQSMAFGIRYASLGKRYDAQLIGVIRAVLSAYRAICTLIALSATGYYLTKSPIALHVLLGLLGILASIVVHEYGHIFCIRMMGGSAFVLRHASHIRIVHTRFSNHKERLIASAGPIAGALCGAILYVLDPHMIGHLVIFGIVLLHALSVLPWYADGAALFHVHTKEEL